MSYFFIFILQNNIKITILTFMNVDGAFILAETCRKTSVLLFVDNSMQIFLRYLIMNLGRCLSHVSHCYTPLKKEQMMSNCFRAEFPCALDFEPWRRALIAV